MQQFANSKFIFIEFLHDYATSRISEQEGYICLLLFNLGGDTESENLYFTVSIDVHHWIEGMNPCVAIDSTHLVQKNMAYKLLEERLTNMFFMGQARLNVYCTELKLIMCLSTVTPAGLSSLMFVIILFT